MSVGCCKHYGASPDESRPSGSQNLACIVEKAPGEKRLKVGFRRNPAVTSAPGGEDGNKRVGRHQAQEVQS